MYFSRIIFALFGVCIFLISSSVSAQNITAQVNWYGTYEGETKEIEDPSSPTGKRYNLTLKRRDDRNQANIQLRKGTIHFGFSYTLSDGTGSKREVEVEEVYFLPNKGLAKREVETGEPQYRIKRSRQLGGEYIFGWSDSDGRSPDGQWVIELHYQGRVIASQRFFVEALKE